ncbi:hypothetical protein BDW59DRAFT_149410 [Aspergillus cavernicola]|uniref:Uncharacterized protein n=1 Tax=Aspergillus cavernicola TaxID=176166 RepID=A0ABR4I4Q1_9EURO
MVYGLGPLRHTVNAIQPGPVRSEVRSDMLRDEIPGEIWSIRGRGLRRVLRMWWCFWLGRDCVCVSGGFHAN